ncbi:MAG: hypothetical protein M1308_09010 [Actinobacteria bacterium]|nr:hypothetical protein [Actinomycetota bacterium]
MNDIKTGKTLKISACFIFTALIILSAVSIVSCKGFAKSSTISETAIPGSASTPEESANTEINDISQIKTIVESFGKVLASVSLLSPPDIFENDIKKYYSPFLSKELISEWMENPSEALGRLTSSPWPDHIEIIEVKKVTVNKYEVSANVVEITSVEEAQGGYADKYGVDLTLERINEEWLIVEAVKDLNTSS